MNLELLIKLVKLANHNNSEGEANTAARRVCKMIEEADFKFIKDTPIPNNLTYDTVVNMYYGYYNNYTDSPYSDPNRSGFRIDYFNNIVICTRCKTDYSLEGYRNMPNPHCPNCGINWK